MYEGKHEYSLGIAEDLERSDWTPEEALRWYAAGKHFDTMDNHTRIIDTGAIASNALKHASLQYLELKGDSELSELRAELASLKAGQGEADDYAAFEAFMEINGSVNEPRAMQYMLWKQGRNAPPAPADARSVPVDILERVVSQFEDDCTSFSYDVDDIRAILARPQGVKP